MSQSINAGQLRIAAQYSQDMLELSITDDGVGLDAEFLISTGHGLDNTRERLQALSGDRALLKPVRRMEDGCLWMHSKSNSN